MSLDECDALGRPSFSNSLTQTGVNAESFCGFAEWLISCPQQRGRIDKDSGYELCVDQTDA